MDRRHAARSATHALYDDSKPFYAPLTGQYISVPRPNSAPQSDSKQSLTGV